VQVSDLTDLLGTPVRSVDGVDLGRVGSVHVPAGLGQPLLVTFPADSDTPYAAPLFGAELSEAALRLGYPADLVTGGPTVDAAASLSAGEVGYILGHYRPGRPAALGTPVTHRRRDTGDVGADDPDVRELPAIPSVEDRDLPPIVVTRPGLTGPLA
jgi:hypothetical protein